MSAHFELTGLDDGTFTFVLKSANGEVVATSQVYQSESDAVAGMTAVKDAAAVAVVPPDKIDDRMLHMH